MMNSRAAFSLLVFLTAAGMAAPAQAALIRFTFTSGTVTGAFTIDSVTAPTVYSPGKYADYHGVDISFGNFPTRPYEVSFFTATDGGGISIAAPGGGQKSVFGGPQVFAGLVTQPQFENRTYTLLRAPYGALGELTISGAPVSAVPLPPGLPLFATALLGIVALGGVFRKTTGVSSQG